MKNPVDQGSLHWFRLVKGTFCYALKIEPILLDWVKESIYKNLLDLNKLLKIRIVRLQASFLRVLVYPLQLEDWF
jgi:hypothetical protein